MEISKQAAREELQRRSEAKDSLLAFTAYTHEDWQTGEHHKVVCEHLEAVERGECLRFYEFRHVRAATRGQRLPPVMRPLRSYVA